MIQIAGVKTEADLRVLIDAGVGYIGFPLRLNFHPEDISDVEVKRLISLMPETVEPVLITYLNQATEVQELAQFIGARVVQIHSDIAKDELAKLKQASSFKIIKSLVVREGNFEELKTCVNEFSALVDYFITDTFDPATGAEGATGKTHDWKISRELVSLSGKPVILAGGLKPHNVEEAILSVKPAGVDAHTGVEDSKGNKDPRLVQQFVESARRGLLKVH